MYLLDTNHCSRIIRGDAAIINRATQIGEQNLFICAIVQGELIYMMEKSQHQEANLAVLHEFLQDISIYRLDEQTAKIYGQLKATLFNHYAPKDTNKRREANIASLGFGDNDLWIAAIALQHSLTPVTADLDFNWIQQIQPLVLESWL